MSTGNEPSGSVPIGWILLFVLLALGATIGAIFVAGGGEFGVLLPPFSLH